jgi:hypothetical protein
LNPIQVRFQTAPRPDDNPARSHLKKVFSSDIGVKSSSQVLDILEYACGLILGLALIPAENPDFEMASNNKMINTSNLRCQDMT